MKMISQVDGLGTVDGPGRRTDVGKAGVRPPKLLAAALAVAIAPAVPTGVVFAASDDGHREHEAHAHGHGTLDIVVEGETLVVEFRIPAVNVVGFEHAPRDDAEREAVRKALVPFGNAASVLLPSQAAQCEIEKAEAGVIGMDHEAHHEDEAHGHDEAEDHHEGAEHGHEDDDHETDEHGHEADGEHEGDAHGHEDDGHEGHEHEESAADSGEEEHSEVRATYRFHCHAPQQLARIEVRLFEHLHDAEEIDVRIVTGTAQMAMALHPGETIVELSP